MDDRSLIDDNGDLKNPINFDENPFTPRRVAIISVIVFLTIGAIIYIYAQYLGNSGGIACGTKRRTIETDYFQAARGYGVVEFEEFRSANYGDRSGACMGGGNPVYTWDNVTQSVVCSKHDNVVYPITLRPEDGTNLQMLANSLTVYGVLNSPLPPRNENGALVWSEIDGDDPQKADFWKGYFKWINNEKFAPDDIGSLMVFYAKDGGEYTDEIVGVYFKIGSSQRVYFTDTVIKNGNYLDYISDGQLSHD